jgi:hypothetical protein
MRGAVHCAVVEDRPALPRQRGALYELRAEGAPASRPSAAHGCRAASWQAAGTFETWPGEPGRPPVAAADRAAAAPPAVKSTPTTTTITGTRREAGRGPRAAAAALARTDLRAPCTRRGRRLCPSPWRGARGSRRAGAPRQGWGATGHRRGLRRLRPDRRPRAQTRRGHRQGRARAAHAAGRRRLSRGYREQLILTNYGLEYVETRAEAIVLRAYGWDAVPLLLVRPALAVVAAGMTVALRDWFGRLAIHPARRGTLNHLHFRHRPRGDQGPGPAPGPRTAPRHQGAARPSRPGPVEAGAGDRQTARSKERPMKTAKNKRPPGSRASRTCAPSSSPSGSFVRLPGWA